MINDYEWNHPQIILAEYQYFPDIETYACLSNNDSNLGFQQHYSEHFLQYQSLKQLYDLWLCMTRGVFQTVVLILYEIQIFQCMGKFLLYGHLCSLWNSTQNILFTIKRHALNGENLHLIAHMRFCNSQWSFIFFQCLHVVCMYAEQLSLYVLLAELF